jgi:hypothetical protein
MRDEKIPVKSLKVEELKCLNGKKFSGDSEQGWRIQNLE